MSETKILATVGFCVKDEENTIRHAIESVTRQDFPHECMEMVFVDDGSTDGTLQVIEECVSKIDIRTKVLHTEWRGLGQARQTVVENANGKYIIFVDGDSRLSANYVSKQIDVMRRYPTVGIASGLFGVCPEDNWVATLENVNYVVSRLKHKGKMTSNLISTAGSIMRVAALKQVGGFDPEIRGSQEDIDIAYRLKRAGWLSYVSDAVFYHSFRRTWKALWQQHVWYGYGLHFLLSKNKGQNPLRDKSVDRILLSSQAYKLTGRKVVFLLPLNFIFKKIALACGFLMARANGYGYRSNIK
jgi:glycosyltransferase involved in cell wall biosynthesis